MKKGPISSVEVDLLRIAMIHRGLKIRDVARMAGLPASTMGTAFTLNFPNRRTRMRVEAALDLAIWSSPEDLAKRQRCKARLGVDPAVDSVLVLLRAADRAGIDLCGCRRTRAAVVRRIEEHLAANPSAKFKTNGGPAHTT